MIWYKQWCPERLIYKIYSTYTVISLISHWQHTIRNSKKLEFYNTFKDEYTPSCYLDLTRKLNNRKELVKLRIGNHKLFIENGRYDQIPRDNRLCPTCKSNQIEDEIHLLFSIVLNTVVLEMNFTKNFL